ncbi:MAG: LysM peptidoglycan-binding domain-containing protein [Anaerolineae bacterium]|nr:LysM peptidoglycan-binding domain-containing protein [Anaerolineae bacterium]
MWKLRINMGLVLLGLGLVLVACQPQAEPAAAVDAVSPGLSVLLVMPTATATTAFPSLPTAPPTLTPMPAVTDTAVPATCVPVQPNGWVLTTVQPGNTLYGLARRGGTTVAELVRVNCRENDILYVGELLYTPPGSGYTVAQPRVSIVWTPPSVPPIPPIPPIPPAPPPCETPPCEDDILPTLPPSGETGGPPDELPLLPTLPPPDGNEPAYPAAP